MTPVDAGPSARRAVHSAHSAEDGGGLGWPAPPAPGGGGLGWPGDLDQDLATEPA